MDQGGNSRGWEWLGSWDVLKIEPMRFAEGLDVRCEEKKKRNSKEIPKFLA